MKKAIVVQAEDKGIVAQVKPSEDVSLASATEINNVIKAGADELMDMLSGNLADPAKKRCRRCARLGRVPYHPLEDFSLLKNGKRHSQCKVCRVEQANEWCTKRAEHRKTYHHNYYKSRPKHRATPKGVLAIMKAYQAEAEPVPMVSAKDALFVAFTDSDIQETN